MSGGGVETAKEQRAVTIMLAELAATHPGLFENADLFARFAAAQGAVLDLPSASMCPSGVFEKVLLAKEEVRIF